MKLGVLTVILGDLTLDETLKYLKGLGVQAVEIGCEDTWFITPNGLDATETLTLPDGSILLPVLHRQVW